MCTYPLLHHTLSTPNITTISYHDLPTPATNMPETRRAAREKLVSASHQLPASTPRAAYGKKNPRYDYAVVDADGDSKMGDGEVEVEDEESESGEEDDEEGEEDQDDAYDGDEDDADEEDEDEEDEDQEDESVDADFAAEVSFSGPGILPTTTLTGPEAMSHELGAPKCVQKLTAKS